MVASTHTNENSTVAMWKEGFSFFSKDFGIELLVANIRKSDLVLRTELLLPIAKV